ncbi:MAG: TerB family tellurite resistance protein [Alphaproteobacteria bacterium]|nr:MAG: TerB family tellurite resistance protein [Alphaproteobacteria bacterium]
MLARLKSLLTPDKEPGAARFEKKQLAAAVLLAEAAYLDDGISEIEHARMIALMQRFFGLSADEAKALVAQACAVQGAAVELSRFTQAVKDAFDAEERIDIIEMLWEVVYADGVLHAYEDNLMRRIGGLLYVSDKDRGRAKARVKRRLGLD